MGHMGMDFANQTRTVHRSPDQIKSNTNAREYFMGPWNLFARLFCVILFCLVLFPNYARVTSFSRDLVRKWKISLLIWTHTTFKPHGALGNLNACFISSQDLYMFNAVTVSYISEQNTHSSIDMSSHQYRKPHKKISRQHHRLATTTGILFFSKIASRYWPHTENAVCEAT